jgi:predicted nucleic acid-binding protein
LVAALIEADDKARASLGPGVRHITSALTLAESSRALVRARVTGRLTADQERSALRVLRQFERRCYVVAVTADVLARAARPFPVEPIRTLDAIHLATAELIGEPPQLMSLVTRDRRVRDNATVLGYVVK